VIAYFDTSALIKIIVEEDGSELARRLWNAADNVLTSRLTYPEARAGLAAARRGGRLSDVAYANAKRVLRRRLQGAQVIELAEEIAERAGDLAESHRLRGSDAVHLASVAEARDAQVVVATWDLDLRRAAEELGLAVVGRPS
jgi:predicted nucleic acid-binding protein